MIETKTYWPAMIPPCQRKNLQASDRLEDSSLSWTTYPFWLSLSLREVCASSLEPPSSRDDFAVFNASLS